VKIDQRQQEREKALIVRPYQQSAQLETKKNLVREYPTGGGQMWCYVRGEGV